MKRNRILIPFNILLAIVLAYLLFNKFYLKEIVVPLEYDAKAVQVIELINQEFNVEQIKKVTLVYFFNELPTVRDIKGIERVYRKHKGNVDFFVFFGKKIKFPEPFSYPYKFIQGKLITCTYNNFRNSGNVFLLLKDGNTKHVDLPPDAKDANLLVEKHIFTEKNYQDYAISGTRLKKRLADTLNSSTKKELLNLKTDELELLAQFGSDSNIHVVVSKCTSCELKTMLSDFKSRSVFDDKKSIIIFPVYSDDDQIRITAREANLDLSRVYLDINDSLELFSLITSSNTKMLTISTGENEV